MRIVVEETVEDNNNKRRVTVECESDNVPLEEALDMILRGLLSYGYTSQDISETLVKFSQPVQSEPENTSHEIGDL